MNHPYRVRWDLIIMVLSVVTSLTVPYEIAFVNNHGTNEAHETTGWAVFNAIVDICFAIDIILNFFTTVWDPITGSEIDDKKEIACRYLQF